MLRLRGREKKYSMSTGSEGYYETEKPGTMPGSPLPVSLYQLEEENLDQPPGGGHGL
jgi:hypothetical protein